MCVAMASYFTTATLWSFPGKEGWDTRLDSSTGHWPLGWSLEAEGELER